MAEELIPIVMFISIAVVFVFWFYFKYRGRMELQRTYRLVLDKGNELTPDMIRQLGEPEPDKDRDLRRSLIWFALSIGLVLIGVAVPDDDAFRGTLAGAALPFTIGCAYMIMYRYGARKQS